MTKKLFIFALALIIFEVLASGASFASSGNASSFFDVSINRVILNGDVVSESRENIVSQANLFSVTVEFTSLGTIENGHVEAILTGRQSGNSVSDSTATFNLSTNQNSVSSLRLVLGNRLEREKQFDLTIKVIDARGNREEKIYGITTREIGGLFGGAGSLGVSIDRTRVNGRIVAESSTNFIERSNSFDVMVDFTALETLRDMHIESVLEDLTSGNSVADSTPNFNLTNGGSSSKLLSLNLLGNLKKSDSFELTVKLVDKDGNSIRKLYDLRMRERGGTTGSVGARQIDVSIDDVEVESNAVSENQDNFIVIDESKKNINVKVKLTSLENIDNAHVNAILVFENGDVVTDTTTTFNIDKDMATSRNLKLPLIGPFEQNNLKLKISIVDAEGNSEEKTYGLKLSKQQFPFVVSSIAISPETNVEAGKNLVARLSVKNTGVVPLEGMSVKVSIPELGISATKFVDQIKNSDRLSEIKEDFILKIPDDVPTGTYSLRSEISSQFGGDSEVKELNVFIVGKSDQQYMQSNEKLIINVPVLKQDVFEGREVIYPIALKNSGTDTKSYTLTFEGADWANVRLSDSNVIVLQPKESKTTNIYVSSRGDVQGEQSFLSTIKSNGKVLQQIQLTGNVVAEKSLLSPGLKSLIEVVLMAAVVLSAAAGLFFGFRKYMQGNKGAGSKSFNDEIPNKSEGEAYY